MKTIGVTLSLTLIFLSYSKCHWTTSCRRSVCHDSLIACQKCNGQKQCIICIRDSNPECFQCGLDALYPNEIETINEKEFMICDTKDSLSNLVCHTFCRGKFYSSGQCKLFKYAPVCSCSFS